MLLSKHTYQKKPMEQTQKQAREWLYGKYIQLPVDLLSILDLKKAFFFSCIHNISRFRMEDGSKWFTCPHKLLFKITGFHRQTQWRMLQEFQKKKYIKIKIHNGKGVTCRMVQINYKKVQQDILKTQETKSL